MGAMSIWHWLILLVVVALGKDLGGAIKGFKEGMKEASDEVSSIDKQMTNSVAEKK